MTLRGLFVLACVACVAGLAACQPGLNWRAARADGTGLTALLPCKPERTSRRISLGGAEIEMQLLSCSAQGSTYAISYASLPTGSDVAGALAHWRRATLAHVAAGKTEALSPATGAALAMSQNFSGVRAAGTAPSGEALQMEAWWFARGLQVFQAVVYTQGVSPQALSAMREPFFEGLQLP
ncbi:MAG: hypothetical protein ACKOWD_14615 [Rhodoferax sp.]